LHSPFLIHLSVGVMGSRHRSVSGIGRGSARSLSARSQKSMQNGKIVGARNNDATSMTFCDRALKNDAILGNRY
jgi:hypothetical protein